MGWSFRVRVEGTLVRILVLAENMSSDEAGSYHYTPLDTPEAFRIINLAPGEGDAKIEFSIVEATIKRPHIPDFEAVSYTWAYSSTDSSQPGDSLQKYPTWCDGNRIDVTPNLFELLRRLRSPINTRTLWIDQLCINQADLSERAAQVNLMMHIYNEARSVVLWLGEEDEHTQHAFELLQQIADHLGDIQSMSLTELFQEPVLAKLGLPAFPDDKWASLSQFFKKSIFQRAWIIQEVAVARCILGLCGSQTIPFGTIGQAAGTLTLSNWTQALVAQYGADCRPAFANTMMNMRIRFHSTKIQGLQLLLSSTRRFKATDPRDKIFALLGIAVPSEELQARLTDRDFIQPDYTKSTGVVYRDVTLHLIRLEQSLDILSTVEDSSLRETPDLPSWVPDYNVWQKSTILGMPPPNDFFKCHASGSSKIDVSSSADNPNILLIKGFEVDTIREMTPDVFEETPENSYPLLFLKYYQFIIDQPHAYDGLTGLIDAFWRTLIANFERHTVTYPAPADHAAHVLKYLSHAFEAVGMATPWQNVSLNGDAEVFRASLMYVAPFRRLFVTEKGYIGLGPRSLEVGDSVVLFSGGRFPFVVRRYGEEFMVVGETYTHGIMEGEVLLWQDSHWKAIRLR